MSTYLLQIFENNKALAERSTCLPLETTGRTYQLNRYETWVEEALTELDPNVALGRLAVLTADLLELARRADPAYGLRSN